MYMSSDESESDSSFVPNSSDSEDDAHRPGSKSKAQSSQKAAALEEAGTSAGCSGGEKEGQPGAEESSGDAKDGKVVDVVPPGWTGAEVTYFRMLHPVFGHNYCSIAELVRTKSCQVHTLLWVRGVAW